MFKKTTSFSALYLLFHSVCFAQASGEFSLRGKTSELEDGTKLYFRDLLTGATLDSAIVSNNSFYFDSELPEPVIWVMLHTRDRSKFMPLWLEENEMTFDARETEFGKAKVTGSRTQEVDEEFGKTDFKMPADELKQHLVDFVKEHPNSVVSMKILDMYGNKWGAGETSELYELLAEEVQGSSFGKRVAEFIESDISPRPGEAYLDFSLPDPAGEEQRFSKLLGQRYTLLHFWASTCGPSGRRNTALKPIYEKHRQDGLEIVAVSLDTQAEAWKNAIEQQELPWINLSSLQNWDGKVVQTYAINATPSNYLINAQGEVVARDISPEDLSELLEKTAE